MGIELSSSLAAVPAVMMAVVSTSVGSEEISRALSIDPDRAEAERALLNARKPIMFEYNALEFEDLVTHVTNAFNNARIR